MHNNKWHRLLACSGFKKMLIVAVSGLALGLSTLALANDYPTEARVDYVLGCMAANGQDYLTMEKCSCSIDEIAERVPYTEYEAVETVIRMQNKRGELGMLFRTGKVFEDRIRTFRAAQAQASLQCF
ncbi:MAG TPA: hypothetical protein VFM75_03530 [Modicisalibacter sp.]|nr:hypothetical protein [Modicisalibacter sp.]